MNEKRVSRRFPGRIGVISSDSEGLNFGFLTDLSREGAYVETGKLLPIGSRFDFVVSNGSTEATIMSKVVRSRDAFFSGGRSGLGIHFENLQGLGKRVRDDLLLFFMSQQYQTIWDKDATLQ